LIPCPDDLNYQSQDSILFRRKYAQYLAQSTIESIENEREIPEYVTPSEALADSRDELVRQRFHPQVPQELEDIIALDILSFYEYAQRGNLKKMKNRAGQALVSALALSLHECPDGDEYCEVKGRVWWMTVSDTLGSLPNLILVVHFCHSSGHREQLSKNDSKIQTIFTEFRIGTNICDLSLEFHYKISYLTERYRGMLSWKPIHWFA
jgi:hypothetical protein